MTLKQAVNVIAKRMNHLIGRIEGSDKDLTYDKMEVAALIVAIKCINIRRVQKGGEVDAENIAQGGVNDL
jgi:hypothetical protein